MDDNKDLSFDDDTNPEKDSTLEEKDGVKYETNDNWEFEAEAPTLNDDMFAATEHLADKAEQADNKPASDYEGTYVSNVQPAGNTNNQIVVDRNYLKFIPAAIFVLIIAAVLIVFGVRYYTVPNGKEGNLMNPASVAATIDDSKVSIGVYNISLSNVVRNYEQYALYGYYDLDTTADYSTQFTQDEDGNKISWLEFFRNEAFEQIKMYTTYSKAAKDAGITLTENQQKTIDEQIESFKTSASQNSQSLDEYISDAFGDYCSEQTVRLYLEEVFLTQNYMGKYAADNKPTDEEISKYFDEHQKDYYQINFSYLATAYDASTDEAKAASEKAIKDYASKITDRQSIMDLVPVAYKDYIEQDAASAKEQDPNLSEEDAKKQATQTYKDNIDGTIYSSQSPFSDEVTNWLFDKNEPTGTVKYYINEETGYAYIILKTEQPKLDESETYSVRHILIMPEADDSQTDQTTGQTTYTDEQWAAAEEKAKSILKKYNDGDKTEYAFALLAEANSADTESTTSGSSGLFGGLYEGTSLGEMVPSFEQWATDKSRKYGDTDIVKSDFGYHIMFFISDRPSYESQIVTAIRNEQLDNLAKKADLKLHDSVIKKANDKFLADKKAANESSANSANQVSPQ